MRSSAEKERIHYIDILRGIGIILVVIGHLDVPIALHNYIYSFHMPLFFFLGGLVFKKRDIFYDIKRRFFSLMIPYFIWGIIYIVYYSLMGILAGQGQFDITAVQGLLIGEYSTILYDKTLWFLPCFFVVTITYNAISHILFRYLERHYVIALVLLTIGLGLVSLFVEIPYSVWGGRMALHYAVFYSFGNLIHEVERKAVLTKIGKLPKILFVIAFGILHIGLMISCSGIAGGSLIIPLFAILAWFGMARLMQNVLAFFELFGRVSMDIFCTENLSASLIQNTNEHIFGNKMPIIIELLAILFLCLLYSYAIKRALLYCVKHICSSKKEMHQGKY